MYPRAIRKEPTRELTSSTKEMSGGLFGKGTYGKPEYIQLQIEVKCGSKGRRITEMLHARSK